MASSIPGAVNALITMLDPTQGGSLPAGTQVWFGRPMSEYEAPQAVQITAVTVHEDYPAELGPNYRHEEVFSIECVLFIAYGDGLFLQRLDDAFTLYNTVATTVANNPTLNGTVREAFTKKASLIPDADSSGMAIGVLNFSVDCSQRVASLT